MVCVPCFIIPALLFLWRLLRPYIQRFWNPIEDQAPAGNDTAPGPNPEAPGEIRLPFGITCPTCPIRGPCPKLVDSAASSESPASVQDSTGALKVEKVD